MIRTVLFMSALCAGCAAYEGEPVETQCQGLPKEITAVVMVYSQGVPEIKAVKHNPCYRLSGLASVIIDGHGTTYEVPMTIRTQPDKP